MSPTSDCPEIAAWERLLTDEASPAAEASLLAHLETCPVCRQQVERLGAGDLAWNDVAQRLRAGAAPTQAPPPPLVDVIRRWQHDPPPVPGEAEGATGGEVSPDLPPGFLTPPRAPGQLGCLDVYEVYEEVGRGAMGVVLRAFDPQLHRVVAIKVLSPHLASYPLARQRFVREGHATAAVCHEHVVAIHAIGEAAGLPYLVMQFVSGKTLQQRLDQGGPLKPAEILRIGRQAAAGLAAAHAQGLVHRDIKPANLLLENGVERVKITDFGLARAVDDASLTQTGVITGTPQYMAPEQARGEPIDARADLFSLGCVLYALCTGRPPFRGPSTLAVMKRICEATPRSIREQNPDIPDWLEGIVMKLLVKQPAARFASAHELEQLLDRCLEHWQQPTMRALPAAVGQLAAAASASPPQVPSAPWTTRYRVPLLIAAVLGPLLLVFLDRGLDRWLAPSPAALSPAAPSADSSRGPHPTAPSPPTPADSTSATPTAELDQRAERALPGTIVDHDRRVGEAEAQWRRMQQRHERGYESVSELLSSESRWVEAQIERARARKSWSELARLFQRLVEIRQRQLDLAQARREAGVAVEEEVLAADRALSEARLNRLPAAIRYDQERLAGQWRVTALKADAMPVPPEMVAAIRFEFRGDSLHLRADNMGVLNFRVQLDPTANPPRIDWTQEDGTDRSHMHAGIYELAGDHLRICLGTTRERPRAFTSDEQSPGVLYTLERVHTAP
ncbi:MAG: protein kinase [Pirellulales bacterium]